MPLPPYIHEHLEDRERYQTVYAKQEGSAAAPTAGLHFTPELLGRIREKGIDIVPVLLHVGLGTFRPVKVENIEEHEMHAEFFEVTPESAQRINAARARGSRIVAVGTTSVRTLESAAEDGVLVPKRGETRIFIRPGYRFQMVDALITNFHLPGSTLMMLVSALYDREHILSAYEEAVIDIRIVLLVWRRDADPVKSAVQRPANGTQLNLCGHRAARPKGGPPGRERSRFGSFC